ncbi:hypothetical protein A9G42_03315 [Gilliamella sp. Nev6-6]|uniref:hypothetical protein n=1 Tax=unclassified Gilliamella TaxID=2685620 RepID=UPI00080DB038|nr:hypothetical protein [Gilliamella apicola]OCG60083.1 hypothetical protein A9G40_05185 [Gilliamella apicola]OCG78457.1 hypothetical protein A9G42_03315 [Gilliamella apicola]
MVKFFESSIDNKNNILRRKTSIKNMNDAYFKLEWCGALIIAFRSELMVIGKSKMQNLGYRNDI